ncbi:hypothetical protein ACOME3_005607 [Neoechinorhynchus agilis]
MCRDIAKLCATCGSFCKDLVVGSPGCDLDYVFVPCPSGPTCALRRFACCDQNSVLCNGKCLNRTELCALATQNQYIADVPLVNSLEMCPHPNTISNIQVPRDVCEEYRCGNTTIPSDIRVGNHLDSKCTSMRKLCEKCSLSSDPCDVDDCTNKTDVPLGCVNPQSTKRILCMNSNEYYDCKEGLITCGKEFGYRCVNRSSIEQRCREQQKPSTQNPQASMFRSLTIALPISIAVLGLIGALSGIVSAIPMLRSTLFLFY